jgi:hypothetical protein
VGGGGGGGRSGGDGGCKNNNVKVDVVFLNHNMPESIMKNPAKLAEQINKSLPEGAEISQYKLKYTGEIILFPKSHEH